MTADQSQELVTISRHCVLGLIGNHKTRHVECQNRGCKCLCHNPGRAYPKSWKAETGEGQ